MSYSQLFFEANEQLRITDFSPIRKEVYELVNKDYWDETYKSLPFEAWEALLTENGYDVNKIMLNNTLNHIYYINNYSTVNLATLDPSWLLFPLTLGSIEKEEIIKQDFLNGDYFGVFFPEWNKFSIDYFIRLYKELDVSKVWITFKLVYTYSDYGFSMFPREVIDYVLRYADNVEELKLLEELSKVVENGYITIFRGEGERSTAIEQAYSWTLSKEVAISFANRFGKGKVYEAKVKFENVLDFEDERGEKEVLVRYEYIEDLKECSF